MFKQILFLCFLAAILSACNAASLGEDDGGHQNEGEKIFYSQDEFVMGVDLSYVNQILDHGGVFRDSGRVKDPYQIFADYGANMVRLRKWHNPKWTIEVYNGDGEQRQLQ